MKTNVLFTAPTLLLMVSVFGQKPTIELTFTAIDSAAYVQSDSIKVMNRAQGCDTVLYWPDTVLSIYYVSIPEMNKPAGTFQVFQNVPNPVVDQTTISLYVPEKDNVRMIVTDILGRVILNSNRVLDKGIHSFLFTPAGGNPYFFTAQWRADRSAIKILPASSRITGASSIEYLGNDLTTSKLKAAKDIQSFCFNPGDTLLYIGYADGAQSGMLDAPEGSQSFTFQFATNIPCPGTPTVTYEGQVYNTVQIFSQCWLKENLNVGAMIPGNQNQTNNGIMEKYCHNNQPDSCTKYGGLYQWDEMMQYTTQQGSQGICPPDWHLPTDEEWKVLEGAVDSQFGIGDNSWDYAGLRGFDAGKNLKTTSGWNNNGNGTDLFGFSAMPGSYRILSGGFDITGHEGVWWMSTESVSDYAWYRNIWFYSPKVGRFNDSYSYIDYGFSVRCLRNN